VNTPALIVLTCFVLINVRVAIRNLRSGGPGDDFFAACSITAALLCVAYLAHAGLS